MSNTATTAARLSWLPSKMQFIGCLNGRDILAQSAHSTGIMEKHKRPLAAEEYVNIKAGEGSHI